MAHAPDFPFDEIVAEARHFAAEGCACFQKFTCKRCGQRLTMDEPNKFWHEGSCDKCGAVTDIKAQGCNYMLVKPGNTGRMIDELVGPVPRTVTICEPQKRH